MRIVEQMLQEHLLGELPEAERSAFLMQFESITGRSIRTKEIIRIMRDVETPEE